MKLRVNGQSREIPPGSTVASLLEDLDVVPERVAVERNGAIVPKADYEATALAEDDRLEVVQFVGGG